MSAEKIAKDEAMERLLEAVARIRGCAAGDVPVLFRPSAERPLRRQRPILRVVT
jgi:hypothetical protein